MRAYQKVAPTLALVMSALALTLGGAVAKQALVGSGGIKNGSVRSADLAKGAVRKPDLAKNSVRSSALADGAVTTADVAEGTIESGDISEEGVKPEDVAFPEAGQLVVQAPNATIRAAAAAPAENVGNYLKQSAESEVQVTWTGTAATDFSQCIFQLRVGGQPAADGAGQVFVSNGTTEAVAVTATWKGLPPGPVPVEVWAHSTQESAEGGYPCTVGPAAAQVPQTFAVTEIVR